MTFACGAAGEQATRRLRRVPGFGGGQPASSPPPGNYSSASRSGTGQDASTGGGYLRCQRARVKEQQRAARQCRRPVTEQPGRTPAGPGRSPTRRRRCRAQPNPADLPPVRVASAPQAGEERALASPVHELITKPVSAPGLAGWSRPTPSAASAARTRSPQRAGAGHRPRSITGRPCRPRRPSR